MPLIVDFKDLAQSLTNLMEDLSAIFLNENKSEGLPSQSIAIIALVFLVTSFSTSDGEILNVKGSTSAKTGLALDIKSYVQTIPSLNFKLTLDLTGTEYAEFVSDSQTFPLVSIPRTTRHILVQRGFSSSNLRCNFEEGQLIN